MTYSSNSREILQTAKFAFVNLASNVALSFSPSYAFSVLDSAEDYSSGQRIKEHEEKHAKYDEEALANRYANCQHQHLQSGMLAGDGKEPEDHDHESDHIGQIILKVTARMSPTKKRRSIISRRRTYLHRAVYNDPNNTDDCYKQIISVSSGLPITTRCKSDIFHDHFHKKNQC